MDSFIFGLQVRCDALKLNKNLIRGIVLFHIFRGLPSNSGWIEHS